MVIAGDVLFPRAPTAAQTRTFAVQRGSVQSAVTGTGTVVPASQQNLSFRVSGQLTDRIGPRIPASIGVLMTMSAFAVSLLTFGSIIPVVGWLAGVLLLWTGRRWRTWEKVLGTLVIQGLTLPLLIKALKITSETGDREEALAWVKEAFVKGLKG